MRPCEFICKNVQGYLAKFPGWGESNATILSIIDYLEYQHELSIQNTLMATKKKKKVVAKKKKAVKKVVKK